MSCVKNQPAYTVLLIGSMHMDKPRPYILAALLCENVIEDKTGSLSVIRIADKVEFETQGMPEGYKPVIAIKGLVAIRSGPVKGEFILTMKVMRPNGEQKGAPITLPTVKLLGGDQGSNTILNLNLGVEDEGLHWFDIYFQDDLLTRIPLTVVRKQEPPTQKQTTKP